MLRKIQLSRGVLAGAMVMMMGLALGGCSDQNLQTQNSQLLKQNQQLAQQLAAAKANLASTRQQLQQQQQIAAAAAQQAATPPTAASQPPANAGAQSNYNSVLPSFNNSASSHARTRMINRHRKISRRVIHSSREVRRFVLSSDVLFASASARLQFRAEHALLRVARILRTRYAHRRIRIEGYTDNRPIHHPYPNNYALGLARARAVETFLARHGISRRRMSAVSFGDHRMISRTDLAKDRRVEIVVLR
ncbi:MAG: OmpA family protein [Planctomycetia bacterium]|nr:OmpA family protein [Planctomycetia bacterium]